MLITLISILILSFVGFLYGAYKKANATTAPQFSFYYRFYMFNLVVFAISLVTFTGYVIVLLGQ